MGLLNPYKNVHNFDPSSPIPDLADKVIIVTGGNQGLGRASVQALAKHSPGPKRLYLAARSKQKYDAAIDVITTEVPDAASKITFLQLDLADFDSIKTAADQVLTENDRLDILMSSAGVMGQPAAQTKQGYEIHFGTNHMGHALLTKLLLPLLQKTAQLPKSDVRIVNVSSAGYALATSPNGVYISWDENPDTAPIKTSMSNTHSYLLYGASKLANILHAKELSKRYPAITSVSVHPGRVATNLLEHMFSTWYSPTVLFQRGMDLLMGTFTMEKGALSQLWAAVGEREHIESGKYYVPVGWDQGCGAKASDAEIARKLWEWQEAEFARAGFK